MGMRFGVLGPLEVASEDGELVVAGARRRALLVRLLVSANRPVAAARLAEDLWEGEVPKGAGSTLQSHISLLRRVLGADRVVHRQGGYAFVVDEDELDMARFERFVSAGRRALSSGNAARARECFADALGCWRGAALSDVADAAWAQGEARRLEKLKRSPRSLCWRPGWWHSLSRRSLSTPIGSGCGLT